ncbi:MAG: C10 family peptidase, partial [Kiritimatiellae bacterium]|nr:C10 family peptidase [Kiritimatiellia bacterium]
MRQKKIAVIAGLVAGLVAGFGYSAEMSSDDALCAVKGWVSLKESLDKYIDGNPASVETYTGRSGTGKFYVVTLEGGGYVVASGDDEVTPILAYSKSGTFEASEKNPLWCLLAGRAAIEADRLATSATGGRRLAASASMTSGNASKWNRLRAAGGANGGKTRLGGAPSPAPTDLRVPELLFSDWAQGRIGNWAGTDYPYCFNMYTPEINGERAVCGCVATSGAQIMRYFQYPTASVTPQTKTCKVDGVDTSLTMMGGTYDWSNMPTNINSMYNQPEANTLAYREAIGKLTYDVGVAVEMWYGASGSGASASDLADALMNVFGYRNAAYFYAEGGLAADKLKKAVLPNLDAKRPCGIGISNTSTEEGHAIVADGYGYS